MMNEYGKSDSSIVPEKLSNKACKKAAEAMEERELTKGNRFEQNITRTQRRTVMHSALRLICKPARIVISLMF